MAKHTAAEDMEIWRDLVERAHHLALCVFKGSTKADHERARHNAAVLANAIDHWRQNERNRTALKQAAEVATEEQGRSAVIRASEHPPRTGRESK